MQIFIELFKIMPWWAFGLSIILLWSGLRSLQNGVTSAKSAFNIPLILTGWQIHTLISKLSLPVAILLWLLSVSIGFAIGWGWIRFGKAKPEDPTTGGVPGTLLLIVIFIALRLFFGYIYLRHPATNGNLFLLIIDNSLSAVITGVFIGKSSRNLISLFHK